MAKRLIRNEFYDETGLVRVEMIETDEPSPEDLIAQKEQELLQMYQEIQDLKAQQQQP